MSSQSQPSPRPTSSRAVVSPSDCALHEVDHGVDHFGNPHDDRHDRGLEFDVATLLGRRGILGLLGGLGAGAALAACGTSAGSTATSSSTSSSASSTSSSSTSASSSSSTAFGTTPPGRGP